MKLKLTPMLAGAIALTVAAAPLAVKAQPNQPNQRVPGQAQNGSQMGGVKLNQQQQNQLAQIRRDTRAQIDAILTPKQREQFKVAMQSPQGRRAAFTAMKLSDDQKSQMQAIIQSAQSRAEAILTPQQRQQIQKYIQQQRQQLNQ